MNMLSIHAKSAKISIVRPHPPITRALRMAKEKLVRAGIKVVDFEPYDHQRGWKIIVREAT